MIFNLTSDFLRGILSCSNILQMDNIIGETTEPVEFTYNIKTQLLSAAAWPDDPSFFGTKHQDRTISIIRNVAYLVFSSSIMLYTTKRVITSVNANSMSESNPSKTPLTSNVSWYYLCLSNMSSLGTQSERGGADANLETSQAEIPGQRCE